MWFDNTGDQIEVFKIVNGYEDVDRNMFFKLKESSRTRGHKAALVKEQCRLDMIKYRHVTEQTTAEMALMKRSVVRTRGAFGVRLIRKVVKSHLSNTLRM